MQRKEHTMTDKDKIVADPDAGPGEIPKVTEVENDG